MKVSDWMSGLGLAVVVAGGAWILGSEGGQAELDRMALRRVPGHPSQLCEPVPGRVLVIGDGAAFGVGVDRASSWPNLLRSEHGLDVVHRLAPRLVVRDALRQAPIWLLETRPEIVVLALGADEGFVDATNWTEIETKMLAAWIGDERVPKQRDAAGEVFLGVWISAFGQIDVRADGSVDWFGVEARWRLGDGDFVLVGDPDETVFRWELKDSFLLLIPRHDGRVPDLVFERPGQTRAPEIRISRAIDAGRVVEARARIDSERRRNPGVFESEKQALDAIEGRADPVGLPDAYRGAPTPFSSEGVEDLMRIVECVERAGARVLIVRSPAVESIEGLRGIERFELPDAAVLAASRRYLDRRGHAGFAAALAARLSVVLDDR